MVQITQLYICIFITQTRALKRLIIGLVGTLNLQEEPDLPAHVRELLPVEVWDLKSTSC